MCGIIGKHTVDLGADALIRITINGVLNEDQASELEKKVEFFSSRLENQGFPVYILVDVQNLEEYTVEVGSELFDWISESKFDKLAITRSGLFEEIILSVTAKLHGQKVEFFERVEEAIKWLKGYED